MMFFTILIRWFQLILGRKYQLPISQKTVFLFSDPDATPTSYPLCKHYFPNTVTGKSLNNISLGGLLLGKYHFAGKPEKKNLSLGDNIKRLIVRIFYTNHQKVADILNLVDCIFTVRTKLDMYASGVHVVDILSTHFPCFTHRQLTNVQGYFKSALILFLARLSKSKFIDQGGGVTVFTNITSPKFLKAYRLLNPNRKIYLRFHDVLEYLIRKKQFASFNKQLHLLANSRVVDGIETYSRTDAAYLGITWRPNGVNGDVMKDYECNYRNYLYTFVGTWRNADDQSRLNDLVPVRKWLLSHRPGCKTFINEYIIHTKNISSKRISYARYLEIIAESEIIVDLYRISQDEGLSFRIPEALISGKKVLTNRLDVLNYDFYDPSRFFLIGHDPIERLDTFLAGEFLPLPDDIRKRYDCRYWWGFDPDKN